MYTDTHMLARDIAYEALESANHMIARALNRLHTTQPSENTADHDEAGSICAITYSDAALLSLARQLVRERTTRLKFFESFAFGEPVWDILLDLYIASGTGTLISVSSACIAARVPPTTALRYITLLANRGMIKRRPAPHDSRVIYVSLEGEFRNALRQYLSMTLAQRNQ